MQATMFQKVICALMVMVIIAMVWTVSGANNRLFDLIETERQSSITPVYYQVQPDTTDPIPDTKYPIEVLHTNYNFWEGWCGNTLYYIRLKATDPQTATIETVHGFKVEIKTFTVSTNSENPTTFPVGCFRVEIQKDPYSNWLLWVFKN